MSNGLKVLEIALKEVGTKEDPPGTNKQKYGRWFGWSGVPWCAEFVSWCYAMAGVPLGNVGYPKGYAGCAYGLSHYRKTGEITTNPQPGDIVFFDWNGDGRPDHTGIFKRHIDSLTFETVEGNTAIGNDSNGGEVMIRNPRKYKQATFVHPKVLDLVLGV